MSSPLIYSYIYKILKRWIPQPLNHFKCNFSTTKHFLSWKYYNLLFVIIMTQIKLPIVLVASMLLALLKRSLLKRCLKVCFKWILVNDPVWCYCILLKLSSSYLSRHFCLWNNTCLLKECVIWIEKKKKIPLLSQIFPDISNIFCDLQETC